MGRPPTGPTLFPYTTLFRSQEILAREVRRRRLQAPDAERLERAATELSVGTAEQLQAALGRGDIALGTMMRALYPDLPAEDLRSEERRVGKECRSRWSADQ